MCYPSTGLNAEMFIFIFPSSVLLRSSKKKENQYMVVREQTARTHRPCHTTDHVSDKVFNFLWCGP